LDDLKQLSFYSEILSAEKWSTPKNVIDEKLASYLLSISRSLVNIESVMTSEKELELWIKHIKPTRKQGLLAMKEALSNCYREAVALGLLEEAKLSELERFLK